MELGMRDGWNVTRLGMPEKERRFPIQNSFKVPDFQGGKKTDGTQQ